MSHATQQKKHERITSHARRRRLLTRVAHAQQRADGAYVVDGGGEVLGPVGGVRRLLLAHHIARHGREPRAARPARPVPPVDLRRSGLESRRELRHRRGVVGVRRRDASHLGARRQPLHRCGDGGPLPGDHDRRRPVQASDGRPPRHACLVYGAPRRLWRRAHRHHRTSRRALRHQPAALAHEGGGRGAVQRAREDGGDELAERVA
mmetsp:Transcript_39648/g.125162  ORF Transcript_39648/g.125162 Transcript_39648/m.125162 type:complete len:206 (-) Transcript_39648:19-636(-)